MTREEKVKWLDELENCLIRAEKSRKDIDIIVCLRLLYTIMKERLKEDGNSGSSKL